MSVDPKFANLPWIATDEPDFYESCDLPEADQRKEEVDVEQMLPKEIEKISLSASDAHKRFANCKVDSKNADFSDNISVAGRVGYAVESSEYSLGASDQESVTQRFQRLQLEVRQLMNDAETVAAQMKQPDPAEPLSADQLKQMASALSEQLSALQIEDIFGPNADVDLSGQETILQKYFIFHSCTKFCRPFGDCFFSSLLSQNSSAIVSSAFHEICVSVVPGVVKKKSENVSFFIND